MNRPTRWMDRRPLGRRWPALLVLAASASCAVSQQQEVALGTDYAGQLAQELPLVKDPAVVRYITNLGNSLAQATDTRGLAWHFTVVDSREINAFAVPGGWIYVNRGLIERAQNLSQLAGVLGHEIGHVTRRHSVQQMQQAQGANAGLALLCTLTKVCESGTGQAAINVGGSALFAKFSRSDEQEADAEAVRFEDAQSGVCEAAAAAASDVEAAEAIFFDRAHDSLHELAAALGDTDRVSAARLLEAKQDVEAELKGAARREIVRDDLVALAAVTGDALDVLGIERAECEP